MLPNASFRKELDLLQKLYGLYDAVMNKISGYYKILWIQVDIEKINGELLDFQNRLSISVIITYRPKNLLCSECFFKSIHFNKSLLSNFYRCRKLPKALKDWQAFLDLKKTIDDFNDSCPLLEMMANKSMKRRHWDRIAQVTGHHFEVESSTFTLENIMEAPLLTYKDDIEVCWQI